MVPLLKLYYTYQSRFVKDFELFSILTKIVTNNELRFAIYNYVKGKNSAIAL